MCEVTVEGECPAGDAEDRRVVELTNRGSWPHDPSLDEAENRYVDTRINGGQDHD